MIKIISMLKSVFELINVEELSAAAREIAEVLHQNPALLDLNLCEVFCDGGYFATLDESWRNALALTTAEEAVRIPHGKPPGHWPASMKTFVVKAAALALPREPTSFMEPTAIPQELRRGMKPKKSHEVSRLREVVTVACREARVRNVIDFGTPPPMNPKLAKE